MADEKGGHVGSVGVEGGIVRTYVAAEKPEGGS